MAISQGDVFWVSRGAPRGSEPGFRRPFVVVQNDPFNRSAINTVVVCALTSNVRRAQAPGNILLKKGEANLPESSVVNISQIVTLDKTDLVERIGTLSKERVRQIVEGLLLLLEPRDL